MLLKVHEYGGCFEFEMNPETPEEYVLLARMSRNHTKELRSLYVWANADLTMSASLVLGKRKQAESAL